MRILSAQSDIAAEPKAPQMVKLDPERRAKLIAFIEGNKWIPKAAKERTIGQLTKTEVPQKLLDRLESRMGE